MLHHATWSNDMYDDERIAWLFDKPADQGRSPEAIAFRRRGELHRLRMQLQAIVRPWPRPAEIEKLMRQQGWIAPGANWWDKTHEQRQEMLAAGRVPTPDPQAFNSPEFRRLAAMHWVQQELHFIFDGVDNDALKVRIVRMRLLLNEAEQVRDGRY
jgi:hypothetical protein